MERLDQFKKLVNSPKKVVITTHYKPDADALGSSLGLALYLKKKGHDAQVITPSDYPDFLNWMEGNDEVINFEADKHNISHKIIDQADMIFCLDFNSLERINTLGELVEKSAATKIILDHHVDPDPFADFIFCDPRAAATAELLYELIVKLGDRELMDANIAECLYAGIMTDTGQFKHPNTTKNVHEVTAELIECGADIAKVGKLIYDNNSLDRLKFIGFALSNRLKLMKPYRTAYFWISGKDLQQFNSKTGDTEGLVNYALSLKDVVLAAVIIERPDCIRLSLRSKGNFSVNDFARKNFDGGGHPNAAGGIAHDSLEATIFKFEKIVKSYKTELYFNHQKEKSL
jgi:phosphoesterase RecJ-like protein